MLAKGRGRWAASQKHTMILYLHSTDTLNFVVWTTRSVPSVSALIIIVRGFDCSTLSQTLIFHSVFNLVYVVLGM